MKIDNSAVTNRLAQLLLGKKLLQPGTNNYKLAKNTVETYILNLAPYKQNSKGTNLCPGSTPGCQEGCLFTAGQGRMPNVVTTRALNTEVFIHYRKNFLNRLRDELRGLNLLAGLEKKKYAVRLNGTSDVDFIRLIEVETGTNVLDFTDLIFYDYTKIHPRIQQYAGKGYHLVFSRSETNWADCQKELEAGRNVAVVFHPFIPSTFEGWPVVNGDEHDMRFADPKGVIIGLTAKGKAKNDKKGFVVHHSEWKSSVTEP